MTAPHPQQPGTSALDQMRPRAAQLLGDDAARRLNVFSNSALYVDAPPGRAFLAWLIDVVLVVAAAVSAGIAVYTSSAALDPLPGALAIIVVLLILLPLLYGILYIDGRALGGLITGTRVVRSRDGARVGFWRAGWAMLVRVHFVPYLIWTLFQSGLSGSFTSVRTSIDAVATKKLRRAGLDRLR